MAIERWGSLSVADHTDVHALVANVLLYDRLVMPMFTAADDRDERAYWMEKAGTPTASSNDATSSVISSSNVRGIKQGARLIPIAIKRRSSSIKKPMAK